MLPMSKSTHHPYSQAIEALANDLEKLDAASAHAVIEEAREMARAQWLRQQIRIGEESGEPLDGPAFMAELLAEADADIKAAR
jgi:hypothetical protein